MSETIRNFEEIAKTLIDLNEIYLVQYKRKSIIFVKFATEYIKYVSWGIILDVYIFIGSDILNTC